MDLIKNTIKSRLFYSISLFSGILIFVFLLSICTILFEGFMQKESQSAYQQLGYISQQLEFYLISTDNYSNTILVDPDIQDAVQKYHASSERFTGIDQVHMKQRIGQIIQSIPHIHSVSIYSPDYELIASTAVYLHQNTQIEQLSTNAPVWYMGYQYSNKDKGLEIPVLSLLRPFYHKDSGALLGYVDIPIPESVIANIYEDRTSAFNRIYMIDKHGIVQSSNGYRLTGELYPNYRYLSDISAAHKIIDRMILFSTPFPELDWYLVNEYNLYHFFQPVFIIFLISILIGIACIFLSLLISKRLSQTITSPLYHLISHIQKVKEGVWEPVPQSSDDSDIHILFSEFNSMITAQDQLKNHLIQASFDLLQQQVNPHFLYNTLDNICSLAELNEKETLTELVMNLSIFYRKSLSHGKFHISVKDELEITRSYLQIMQIRYYNKFDFRIDCPAALSPCKCLKLLLQPIVENSVYHGIKELDHKGLIQISVTETDNKENLLFAVLDNGAGISREIQNQLWETDSPHFGIKNIHKRIQLYYGTEYGLTIDSAAGEGCRVLIKIKKQEAD